MPWPPLVAVAGVIALGFCLAWLGYRRLEEDAGRPARSALLWRGAALAGLGLLLLDPLLPWGAAARRPLVLLDRSLSTTAAGAIDDLADSAAALGEVVPFGTDGRSRLAPALRSAMASDRPLVVVTDGEIEDAAELEGQWLDRVQVVALPRARVAGVAVVRVDAADRVTLRDTLDVTADLQWFPGPGVLPDSITLALRSGDRILARTRLPRDAGRAALTLPSQALGAGTHILTVTIEGAPDPEPRDDTRLLRVTVAPSPGLVMVARPGDWDARFLYQALLDVTDLPVEGYLHLGPAAWRSLAGLRPVPEALVRRHAAAADLLVVKGAGLGAGGEGRVRAVLRWPSGAGGEPLVPGDWYLTGTERGPVAGLPGGLDSLPPLSRLTPVEPPRDGWALGTAQLGRRGAPRPVITGEATATRREVNVWADGFWRWAFRGGASEQAYRSLVGALVTWLLQAPDSASGPLRLQRPVVEHGLPLRFAWAGDSSAPTVAISFVATDTTLTDSLRFDGAGIAEVRLPPGIWRYASPAGEGLVAVEAWSAEYLPRPVTLGSRGARAGPPSSRIPLRARWWPYLLVVAAFGAEWWVRRRAGLR